MKLGWIRQFFGAKPAPAQTKTEPAPVKSAPESAPRQAVEDGFLYTSASFDETRGSFYRQEAETLEDLWSGNQSYRDMNSGLDRLQSKVFAEKIRDSEIQELIAKDQGYQDVDDRVGHVVIPEKEFEYHGDRKTVRYPEAPGLAKREGDLYSLQTSKGFVTLNTSAKEVTFQPKELKVLAGADFSSHTRQTLKGEFQTDSDGRIILPGSTSLEEADRNAPQRELAQQAQGLLESVDQFRATSNYRLDQRQIDHHPDPLRVVAQGIDEHYFIRDTGLPHLQHQTYAIETSPEKLKVYEDSHGKTPEIVLESTQSEGRIDAQRAYRNDQSSLKVSLDKSTGIVTAQVLESKAEGFQTGT